MKRTSAMLSILALAVAAATACNSTKDQQEKVPAIDLANLDTSVDPGEDFYRYADGGWMKNNPLKPEFSRYGAFDVLAEANEIRLNDLFKDLAGRQTVSGTSEQKIADLYKFVIGQVFRNEIMILFFAFNIPNNNTILSCH